MHRSDHLFRGIGLKYTSRLTFGNQEDLSPSMPLGERCPPGPIVRLSDWRPFNIQDLMLFNGLFKILVFSGDIRNEEQAERLALFSDSLGSRLPLLPAEMSETFTIIRGRKEGIEWKTIPLSLREYER